MSDIVERLREVAGMSGDNECLAIEAADEIERLRLRIADLEEQILRALGERPSAALNIHKRGET